MGAVSPNASALESTATAALYDQTAAIPKSSLESAISRFGIHFVNKTSVFSPDVRWVGAYVSRSGSSAQARHMASWGVRPRKVFSRRALSALAIVAVSYARIAVTERNAAKKAQALAEHNAEVAERRAWLAQVAATEVRRQSDLLSSKPPCP